MEKKLLIIATGGTISQQRDEVTGASVNAGKKDSFVELIQNELDSFGFTADTEILLSKDSSNIVPDDWVKIIDTIVKNYDEYSAFLITHGTNTLGYTSAALSFALGNLGKRVVLTGSQVPYLTSDGKPASGSDVSLNLQNAARVAMTNSDRLVGVMTVFGSKIITGARVKKYTEFDYDGFDSYSTCPLIGRIGASLKFDDDGLAQHMKWHKLQAKTAKSLQVYKNFNMNIAILTEFPGMKPGIFKALVNDAKIEAFILRSFGAGDPNVPMNTVDYTNLREGFEFLQSREIPIVVTTQAARGIANMEMSDNGEAARGLGAIPAFDMSIEAITVKLAWLLGQNMKYEQIRREMTESVKGEIIHSNQ
jgi:L-asparaginase